MRIGEFLTFSLGNVEPFGMSTKSEDPTACALEYCADPKSTFFLLHLWMHDICGLHALQSVSGKSMTLQAFQAAFNKVETQLSISEMSEVIQDYWALDQDTMLMLVIPKLMPIGILLLFVKLELNSEPLLMQPLQTDGVTEEEHKLKSFHLFELQQLSNWMNGMHVLMHSLVLSIN